MGTLSPPYQDLVKSTTFLLCLQKSDGFSHLLVRDMLSVNHHTQKQTAAGGEALCRETGPYNSRSWILGRGGRLWEEPWL